MTIASPDLSELVFDGQIKMNLGHTYAGECKVSPSHAEHISGKIIPFCITSFFRPE